MYNLCKTGGQSVALGFFFFIYPHNGVYFMKQNVKKKVCLFLRGANATKTHRRDKISRTLP